MQEQTATNVANHDLPSVQHPGGGGPSVDVYPHETTSNFVMLEVHDVKISIRSRSRKSASSSTSRDRSSFHRERTSKNRWNPNGRRLGDYHADHGYRVVERVIILGAPHLTLEEPEHRTIIFLLTDIDPSQVIRGNRMEALKL